MESGFSVAPDFPIAGRQVFDLVRNIAPPTSVIHVGAGNGAGAFRLWSDAAVSHVLLVDANPREADRLATATARVEGWRAAQVLLGDQDGQAENYFVMSVAAGSGRVGVDDLRAVWPNLRDVEVHRVQEWRLDTLLDGTDDAALQTPNWIYVDCFPALPVITGAGRYLDGVDVVWARVLLEEYGLAIPGSSLSDVSDYLGAQGFRAVQVVEGIHPAFGEAVFVRDWKTDLQPEVSRLRGSIADLTRHAQGLAETLAVRDARIGQLNEALEAQTRALAERDAQVAELAGARDAQGQVTGEQQAQIAQLREALETLTKQAEHWEERIAQITRAHDRQARVVAERQMQVATLIHAREVQARLSTERQARLDELRRQCETATVLASDRLHQIEELTRARDIQAHLAEDLRGRVEKLVQERDTQARLAVERQSEVALLTQARNAQARVAADRQARIEELTQAIESHVHKVADQPTEHGRRESDFGGSEADSASQIPAATSDEQAESGPGSLSSNESTFAQRRAGTGLTNRERQGRSRFAIEVAADSVSRDTEGDTADLAGSLQSVQRRCADLEGELVDAQLRYRRVDEEVLRAEAQIDLIKDILFGDSRL